MTKKAPSDPADLLIGAHTSTAGGLCNALFEGQEIGATTVQIFTSNQKQWHGRTLDEEMIELWEQAKKETGISVVMSHDSYLINLGSCKEDILAKSRKAFREELLRCHALGITYLNFHPGAATESTEEDCLKQIVHSLRAFESLAAQGPTRLLIETTAGQGTSVGHSFEHIGYLIHELQHILPIGVCLDTCHSFAAGYDVTSAEGWEATLHEFSRHVGLHHLRALHVNDSVKPLGSRVDRHAPLGKGQIGLKGFRAMMDHPYLRELPKYLETPDGPPLWKEEIRMLRKFAAHPHH